MGKKVQREDEHAHRCADCGAIFRHKPPTEMSYERYALTPAFVKSHTCEECGGGPCLVIVQPGDESATQEEWRSVSAVFSALAREGWGGAVTSTNLLSLVRFNRDSAQPVSTDDLARAIAERLMELQIQHFIERLALISLVTGGRRRVV